MELEEIYAAAEKARQLCITGEYGQALAIYSTLINEEQEKKYIFARGVVYLEMGDYPTALEDFKEMISIEAPNLMADMYYLFLGICYWYLDRPNETVQVWRESLTAPYTDAAGGVIPPALLLYAAERFDDKLLRKEALQLLRKHARRKLTAWPGAIVPFLLGKTEVVELEKQLAVAVKEALRTRWQCQADFYIALRALREENEAIFHSQMKRCAENAQGYLQPEYYLARWEIKQDFAKQPFSPK